MKKKIIAGVIVLSLISGSAGAVGYTLADKANELKIMYQYKYEEFLKQSDKQDITAFEQAEIKRMESETQAYFEQAIVKKKNTKIEKERIKKEVNQHIEEIKKMIDEISK